MRVRTNFVLFTMVSCLTLAGCSGNQLKEENLDDDIFSDIDQPRSSKKQLAKIPEAGPLIRDDASNTIGKIPQALPLHVKPHKVAYTQPPAHRYQKDTWNRMIRGFRLHHHGNNPRVRSVVNEYARQPAKIAAVAKRSAPYLHMIISEVERRGMPAEVALVAFVESGFNPKAYSRSGAAGLWQFIPSTGKMYGLPRNRQFDARLDPFAATGAALNYLRKLNRQFKGDWLLSFAAYNAGEGRVSRAIKKFKRQNPGQRVSFWKLDLPSETKRYVPKILAYKEVLTRSNRYGINLPHVPNTPQLVQVQINKPVNLRQAASVAGLPKYTLTELNPYFLKGVTSPRHSNRIVLPKRHASRINDAIRSLPPAYASNGKTAYERYASVSSKMRETTYTVRKKTKIQDVEKIQDLPLNLFAVLGKKYLSENYQS